MTTSVSLNPASPQPGAASLLTCNGYGDGKSRTVSIVVDGTELRRVLTSRASFTTAIPGLAAGAHVIEANGMLGCAQLPVTVQGVVVPPVDPPPSTTTIPPKPANGDLLDKDFNDGTIAPFRQVFYVDDHPGDFMGVACDYRGAPASVISFPKDGDRRYLRLSCFPKIASKPDGVWWAVLLSTGADGVGGNPTFVLHNGYVQAAIRQSVGWAAWPDPIWGRDDVPPWGSDEPDLSEALEDGKLHFNVLPYKKNVAVVAPPADPLKWRVVGMAVSDDHITFTQDGAIIGRWNGSIVDINLLADSKVGFPWAAILPDARTPNPTTADLAWVVVSSQIPAGL